jgi:hypothetical protein
MWQRVMAASLRLSCTTTTCAALILSRGAQQNGRPVEQLPPAPHSYEEADMLHARLSTCRESLVSLPPYMFPSPH